MATAIDEVMAAIEEHGTATAEQLAAIRGEIKTERGHREDLERKVNLAKVSGGGGHEVADAAEQFERSVKSWYPARAVRIDAKAYGAYCNAFNRYVRSGERVLDADEFKAMQVGVDPDGGWLVPQNLNGAIVRSVGVNSVIRRIARVLPVGGDLEIPAATSLVDAGWVGETQARPETDGPDIGKATIFVKEVYAFPFATQKLLDDAAFDVEAFLGELIGEKFAELEDAAFIAGDGISKPHGFTTMPTSNVTDAAGTRPYGTLQYIPTASSGALPTNDYDTYDLLQKVVHSLRVGYRQGAVWVMGTDCTEKLSKLKDSNKQPLWQRAMTAGEPPTLLGYPVWEAEQMPAIAADSYSIAFGNFQRSYWIADRLGIRTLRDALTNKPYVGFYSTRRVGGLCVDSLGIKLIKFSAS